MTPRPKLVSPNDETLALAARVSSLKTAHLECRTLGHAWRIVYLGPIGRAPTDVQAQARRSVFSPDGARILKCSRCRTGRTDLCIVGYGRSSYSFLLTGRSYDYADGYTVEGGGLNQHRDVLHHALFEREGEGDL